MLYILNSYSGLRTSGNFLVNEILFERTIFNAFFASAASPKILSLPYR